jgi:putative glutamine amidotransferase
MVVQPSPTPIVGLTAGRAQARWGPWSGGAFLLAEEYVTAVERAGAAAIMLPTAGMLAADPSLALDRIDALVLTGGCDVDPGCYAHAPQRETGPTDPERDACEIALVRAAFARDLPVLATCRGMQLMNVAFGGTLRQHLPGREGERHRRRAGEFTRHSVSLSAGSLAARVAGEEHHDVDSHHHQGVDRVASNFRVSGRAADGLIEAIEDPSQRFALGVQWHPEVDEASGLIASLVAQLVNRDAGQEARRSGLRR